LAIMTGPFVSQVSYSALKAIIKYQTLSLQVSNVGGFEQATAYKAAITMRHGFHGPIAQQFSTIFSAGCFFSDYTK